MKLGHTQNTYEELERATIIWDNLNIEECKEKGKEWFFDGTFKTCARDYYQTYVCTTRIEGFSVTPILIIMKDKRQSTYEAAFDFVKDKMKITPKNINFDFERARVAAAKKIWLDVEIHLCFFHLKEPDFRKEVNRLGNLPFVPKEDVVGTSKLRMLE
ncbi:hypothetical protein SNEBB_005886 [Seison nebaliae]|nr:hypothetical protein SNEBB_005886 [Seison nebaliae]